jgi:hypothetical protein
VSLLPIICGEPYEIVLVDITGPFPVNYNGFIFILTVQNHCSRWTETYPLQRHTVEAVAKLLFEKWYCRFGFLLCLLSDLGTEFEGFVMRDLCKMAHIDKWRTCAQTPKTNSRLERFHKTLNSMLAKCVDANQRD